MAQSTSPASSAVIIASPPLYGTCAASKPAMRMNCTAARCGGAPLARGAEIHRALFGLGTFQQFTHGLRGRRRGHSEKQRADAEARHRSEVAQRVLAGAGEQVRVDGGDSLVRHQQRVAVGRGASHLRGTHGR